MIPTSPLVLPRLIDNFCDACTLSVHNVNIIVGLTCIPSFHYHERNLVSYYFTPVIRILVSASFLACKLLRWLAIRDAKLVLTIEK